MMKGEISQYQWVSFFNSLTATQKTTRDITSATGKNRDTLYLRNNVSWSSGDASLPDRGAGATYATVAMSYIGWADISAFLDWAGLRPMSELEYEKAARGPYRPVGGEYSWGSTSITQTTSITNGGKTNEAPGAAANCVYGNHSSVQGPMRIGAMAYGDSTRVASGAGYYGIMDLTGNLWEHIITCGNSSGRSFQGRYHGNGALDSTGDANVTSWPGTNGTGIGFRGGSWSQLLAAGNLRTSDRYYAALAYISRDNEDGGRGVRSAP